MQDNEYSTKVDIEIDYGSVKPTGFSYESHHAKANIRYNMEVEFKSWGINGISTWLPDQKVDIDLEMLADNSEDSVSVSIEIQIVEGKVESDKEFSLNSAIAPKELQLKILEIKAVKNGSFVAKAKGTLVF